MTRLVRSAGLTHFSEIATACGLDPHALVAQAGLPRACLTDPDLKIDAEAALQMLEVAAERAHEPAFGLRMGEARRISNIGPLAIALRDEPTLQHVLNVLMTHIGIHNEALVLDAVREGSMVTVRMELVSEQGRHYRQGTELALLVTLQNIAFFMGPGWRPVSVCLTHSAPRSLAVHRRLLGPRLEFGHEFNGIVFDGADLDAPNPSADPVMARYAEQFLDSLQGQPGNFADQVKKLVLLLLPLGRCNAEVVAQHLGCDRRTVNRRLAEQDLSFLKLVDAHRRPMAKQYVEEGELKLAHIARQLGFASRSSFSRWYGQQFGRSPRG